MSTRMSQVFTKNKLLPFCRSSVREGTIPFQTNGKMCGWKLLFSAFFERLQSCWLSGCDHGVMEDLLFVQAKTSHNAPTWPNQTPRKNITNMENIKKKLLETAPKISKSCLLQFTFTSQYHDWSKAGWQDLAGFRRGQTWP